MHVHIVCDRPEADRILPRKARYLVQYTDWTLSDAPDTSADLNYFMNYIPWRQNWYKWHDTLIAAYFTHRDIFNKTKEQWWDDTARAVDLCITSAQRNLKWLPRERIAFARPPVETDRFVITKPETRSSAHPVVGVSGFTYGDGRKGERLIRDLAQSSLGRKITLKASGRTWPIPTYYYEWQDLHKFFQELDVLVVPSLLEGVPMPPLEALACGIKIVIPTDVGILDELPDNVEGIYRYPVGDSAAFIGAVECAAFSQSVDRQALRQIVVDNYTPDMWVEDHQVAFENLLYPSSIPTDLSEWQGRCGIYVVAFGEPARQCARRLITSARKHVPNIPVALTSTDTLGCEDFFIEQPDADIGGRLAKLNIDVLAPRDWQYIMYLDADTEIIGNPTFLFQLLQDGWEFVICQDMGKYATADMMKRPDNTEECDATWQILGTREGAFQYNGGVFAYRRCQSTERLFKNWLEEWNRWGKRDQGALIRALYKYPLRMYVLPNQWNATTRYELPSGDIAILHHNTKARRWTGIVPGRIDSKEAWNKVVEWQKGQNHKQTC